MKALLLIGVETSFKYNEPLVIGVIWKLVTSAPSVGSREMTRSDVVCVGAVAVFSLTVVALLIDGVLATGLTVMLATNTLPPKPAVLALVDACTLKLAVPTKSAAGEIGRAACREG